MVKPLGQMPCLVKLVKVLDVRATVVSYDGTQQSLEPRLTPSRNLASRVYGFKQGLNLNPFGFKVECLRFRGYGFGRMAGF